MCYGNMQLLQDIRPNPRLQKSKSNMASPESEQEQEEKEIRCVLCKAKYPSRDDLESHYFTHARMITNDLFEEFPNIGKVFSKLEDNNREIKNIGREIEFIEGQQKREAEFMQEQQQREIEFRRGLEQR